MTAPNSPQSKTVELPVNFRDEMLTVIAAVLQTAHITAEELCARATEQEIKAMNTEIMGAFLSVHKRGMKDMKMIAMQGRTI